MSVSLRLVQITDIHLGHAADPANGMVLPDRAGALLDAAVDEIRDLVGVDAVIVSGDLVDGGTPAELADVVARLDRLRVPWYAVPGNHDTAWPPDTGKLDRRAFYTQVARRGAYGRAAELGCWRVQLQADTALIGLDSNVAGDWVGEVDAAQLAWLDATLAAEAARLVIVTVHHPLYPTFAGWVNPTFVGFPWSNFFCRNGAAVDAILDRYPAVRLVLAGHDHLNRVDARNGRLSVATAGLSSYPLVYRILDLDSAGGRQEWRWETRSPADPALLATARRRFSDSAFAREYDPSDPDEAVKLAAGRPADQLGAWSWAPTHDAS